MATAPQYSLSDLTQLLGPGLTALQQNQQNNNASSTDQNASQFGFNATGPNGIGGSFLGGNSNFNLGALQNPYNILAGLSGTQASAAAGVNGLPSNVSAANYMTPGLSAAYSSALSQLFGPAASTANTSFLGAGQQASLASQDPNAYANSVYQNLTAQAQPYEQQQIASQMDSEFGKGQLGSTGGALQTQALAQGLGNADLNRQLQAQSLAQSNMTQAAGRASTLGGLGNSLLSNAFGNFSNLTGQSINNLGAQSSLSFLPANLTGAYLANSGAALTGANNAQQSALNVFNAGLNSETQNSAAIARGGQLQNQLALGNSSLGNASPLGSLLAGLFGGGGTGAGGASGIGQAGSAISALAQLFGAGRGSTSPTMGGVYDPNTGSYDNGFAPGSFGQPDYSPYVSAPSGDNTGSSGVLQNGRFDLSPYSFNSAGGEAATGLGGTDTPGYGGEMAGGEYGIPLNGSASPSATSPSGNVNLLGAASSAFGIANGLQRGGVAGYGGAALSGAGLYNNVAGATGGTAIPGVGPLGNVLGIYNGIQQGGVAGYAGAATNAASLYAAGSAANVAAGGSAFAGAGAAGAAASVAGPIAAAYAIGQMIDAHNTSLSKNYWDGIASTLDAGKGPGGTGLAAVKQNTSYQGALSELMASLTGKDGGLTGGVQSPFSAAQLAKWGITPQLIQQYAQASNAGAPSSAAAAAAGIPQFSTASSQHK